MDDFILENYLNEKMFFFPIVSEFAPRWFQPTLML